MAHQHPIANTNLKVMATITLDPIATITLKKVTGKQNAEALVHQRLRATRPQHHDQRAHGILVVEMIFTFEADMVIPVGV